MDLSKGFMKTLNQSIPPVVSPPPPSQAPQDFNLKEVMDKISKELLDNLNRNAVEDSAVTEELRARLSAKDWTQAKAEKIVAEIRAERAKTY